MRNYYLSSFQTWFKWPRHWRIPPMFSIKIEDLYLSTSLPIWRPWHLTLPTLLLSSEFRIFILRALHCYIMAKRAAAAAAGSKPSCTKQTKFPNLRTMLRTLIQNIQNCFTSLLQLLRLLLLLLMICLLFIFMLSYNYIDRDTLL